MAKKIKPFSKPIYVTRPLVPNHSLFCSKVKKIFESRQLTNYGPQLKNFKIKLQNFLETENLSLFCNGTQALELGIQSLGLKGEVITTPFTFIATVHAVVRNGLKPVFCDIDKENFTINPDEIEKHINKKTSAILAVHVYGNPCRLAKISRIAEKYNLKIIYDAAHAFGVKHKKRWIHEYGDLTMYSFHATKSFNTFEGGALVFKNKNLAEKLKYLKNFGIKNQEEIVDVGTNAKMNEVQAAMGILLLSKFEKEVEKRKKLTLFYRERLRGIKGVKFLRDFKNTKNTYQYFAVLINKEKYGLSRDDLFRRLKTYNIFTRRYFYPLCSQTACYKDLPSASSKNLPMANKISRQIICLPIYGELKLKKVKKITDIIRLEPTL